MVPPFTAEIVAVSPVVPPDTENAGVVDFVMLSVEEPPVSVAGVRSGVPGADGAVVSTVTVVPSVAEPGPETPPDDMTDVAASRGITVPSVQDETVTVNVDVAPETGLTAKLQVEVPAFEKSPLEMVVASTLLLKVRVYENEVLFVGLDCAVVKDDTANATYLTTTIPDPPFP